MFPSDNAAAREREITRLRAECGCEAGAIAALAGFALSAAILYLRAPSGVSPSARWLAALAVAVVAGVVAKVIALASARVRLHRLLGQVDIAPL